MKLIRDVTPLLVIQFALLAITMIFASGNAADCKLQLTWLIFLSVGWLIAPTWTGPSGRIPQRYVAGMISSIAVHGIMASLASWFDLGLDAYVILWCICLLIAIAHRMSVLRDLPIDRRRVPLMHIATIGTLMLFSVAVYRTPCSNDISQFLLQQQDMLSSQSLRVSSIGMDALGVDQAMPRWRANLWHILPCTLANASGVAVDQVLFRYATIPVAFSVLLSLSVIIRSLTKRRATYPLVLLALLGPVVLYYRNFCVFNYSFRVTNNFLLDKDFALFFLLPAIAYLAAGWLNGRQQYLGVLFALIPSVLRFHPLTPVYLILLLFPLFALRMPLNRNGVVRAGVLCAFALACFVCVVLIGDAQSNHEQIQDIIRLDDQHHQAGRPMHYWIGFYNTIPGNDYAVDTTEWTDGRFHLQAWLYLRCGMLLVMQLCVAGLAVGLILKRTRSHFVRIMASGALTVTMLWGMWLVSGPFLTASPHYAAGFERLHWFAYPIAACVIAGAMAFFKPRGKIGRVAEYMILCWICASAMLYRMEVDSPLMHVRFANSMLDQELMHSIQRRQLWDETLPTRSLADLRPSYLKDDDRVLFLSKQSTHHYWFVRQGVFWCDPYVEGYALFNRGESFLKDRTMFYDLLDRQQTSGLANWLDEKGITLIIDFRKGAESYLTRTCEDGGVPICKVSEGIWRVDRKSRRNSNLE